QRSLPGARDVASAVLVPYVVSRVLVFATLGLTREMVHRLDVVHEPVQIRMGLTAWDGSFYPDIPPGGSDAGTRAGPRLFPLFPLVARAVVLLPGVDARLAVVLVANGCALLLGFVLYRLAFYERRDEAFARRAVWFVYLVPPAFVLVFAYAEAM